jgi:hypothetical protein
MKISDLKFQIEKLRRPIQPVKIRKLGGRMPHQIGAATDLPRLPKTRGKGVCLGLSRSCEHLLGRQQNENFRFEISDLKAQAPYSTSDVEKVCVLGCLVAVAINLIHPRASSWGSAAADPPTPTQQGPCEP